MAEGEEGKDGEADGGEGSEWKRFLSWVMSEYVLLPVSLCHVTISHCERRPCRDS